MSPLPSRPAGPDLHRVVVVSLALVALVFAWGRMATISRDDPWYRNTDMNIHNIADALAINSGFTPGIVDQPGAPSKFLLALDFRLRNEVGALPVWHLKRFARSENPLREISRLVDIGREHSRLLVIFFILIAAAFVGQVTRRFEATCLTIVLLSGSAGLLFHGLLLRPELLCTGFGSLLGMHCIWLATAARRPADRSLWLVLAGASVGLALLAKLPGLLYLILVCLWCCVAPLLPSPGPDTPPAAGPSGRWTVAVGLAMSVTMLLLLRVLNTRPELIDHIALIRLRLMAVTVALMPLLLFTATSSRVLRFLTARALELSLVLCGILASWVGWFGLLRTTMPATNAVDYLAKILNTVVYPDPLLALFTHPGEAHRLREMLRFFTESPVLFILTGLLVLWLVLFRGGHVRWRAFALLQFVLAIGMVVLLSKRQFLNQYPVFVEVPLMLTWSFGLAAMYAWWRDQADAGELRWPVSVAMTAAVILSLSGSLKLRSTYLANQDDRSVPVRDLTITFLYDHDAHPAAYLSAMRQRYPTRTQFAEELNRFLADPANR